MMVIYISIPISGREDTYDDRLDRAIREVSSKFPEAAIVTPKDVADKILEKRVGEVYAELTDADYLSADIWTLLTRCSDIYMCKGWQRSKGCRVEYAAAKAYNKNIHYQTIVRHEEGEY